MGRRARELLLLHLRGPLRASWRSAHVRVGVRGAAGAAQTCFFGARTRSNAVSSQIIDVQVVRSAVLAY